MFMKGLSEASGTTCFSVSSAGRIESSQDTKNASFLGSSSKPLFLSLSPEFGHTLFPEPIITALELDFADQCKSGNEAECEVNCHG